MCSCLGVLSLIRWAFEHLSQYEGAAYEFEFTSNENEIDYQLAFEVDNPTLCVHAMQ